MRLSNGFEVKPAKISKGRNAEEILGEEAREMKRHILPRDYLIALDRTGRQYDSEELAGWLEGLFGKATGILVIRDRWPFGPVQANHQSGERRAFFVEAHPDP